MTDTEWKAAAFPMLQRAIYEAAAVTHDVYMAATLASLRMAVGPEPTKAETIEAVESAQEFLRRLQDHLEEVLDLQALQRRKAWREE